MAGRIKVTPSRLREIASGINGVSISFPGINKDTKTTMLGNKKASQTIDEIRKITDQVTQVQGTFAEDLRKYAEGVEGADGW